MDTNNAPIGEDPAIDSLDSRIAAARKAEDARSGHRNPQYDQARSAAASIASTMVGYPIGGVIIGWFLDGVFGTLPWLTIGLMLFAFVCACVQVFRSLNNSASDSAAQPNQE